MGNETSPQRNVEVPAQLFEATERLIAGTRFKSVEEFVAFVLQELTSGNGSQLDELERRVIEGRLRDLGYL